ncbi:MAG: hypothetical protein KGK08_14990 [Acidobacteriota bacterium]|nr:hypothetical protein [Acidobacteriota bacterium]
MCPPAIMVGMAVASTAMSAFAQHQQAAATGKAIEAQSAIQGQEISAAAGQQLNVSAENARAAKAQSIVAAGGAGVNLGSGSFLASLQTTNMNQANDAGLIMENEKNQQLSRVANTQSELYSKASSPTFLGTALSSAVAGGSAYASARMMTNLGIARAAPGS